MVDPLSAMQLRVSPSEIGPEVWHRRVVPIDWTLRESYLDLQAAFGWTECRLRDFIIGELRPTTSLCGGFSSSGIGRFKSAWQTPCTPLLPYQTGRRDHGAPEEQQLARACGAPEV